MPLPFDERNLLPVGIHDATLEEVRQSFGRTVTSTHRPKLFEKLQAYLKELSTTDWVYEVIIDGSFIMPMIDAPNDIDMILVLPKGWDFFTKDLRPFEYNLLSRKATKREYKIEVYAVEVGSPDYQKMVDTFTLIRSEWCNLFGWPTETQKGIVRITL